MDFAPEPGPAAAKHETAPDVPPADPLEGPGGEKEAEH